VAIIRKVIISKQFDWCLLSNAKILQVDYWNVCQIHKITAKTDMLESAFVLCMAFFLLTLILKLLNDWRECFGGYKSTTVMWLWFILITLNCFSHYFACILTLRVMVIIFKCSKNVNERDKLLFKNLLRIEESEAYCNLDWLAVLLCVFYVYIYIYIIYAVSKCIISLTKN
jgi:hypothetical protein